MHAVPVGLLLFSMTWAAPMLNEDSRSSNHSNIHRDLATSVYPEPMMGEGAMDGQGAPLYLPDRDRYGATLLRNTTQPIKNLVTGTELRRDRNQEKRPQSVLSIILADVNDVKDPLKDIKNQQRYLLPQNIPVRSKRARQTRQTIHYLTHLPQIRKIPSDFEGSGSPELVMRGDNDVPPFSGDGQHFIHIPSKGGAVGPGLESSASHPVSGSRIAEVVDPRMNGLGSNEIPGREGHGGSAYATGDKAAQGAGSAGMNFVGGSNEITGGSTNFRELPGKEGNRVDSSSQNAHQGKVGFHYPQVPSKEKDGRECTERTGYGYNEIPKSSKGSSRKKGEKSKGNHVTLTESQGCPGKGKSQTPAASSHSLSTEVRGEGDSSNALSREGSVIAHNRTNKYVHRGQANPTWNKGRSQRRGSWPLRRAHSHRRVSTHQRDSSESSSSGSSSESGAD
ncbi:matrix extracellular phosphoglycoprotein [Mastomys coucha]|uniref:matrix extracellular phosphoglycoprotein n=1 Tax=Mastomys coucha TaxID=35658 RepID=UPI001261936F|nr:matrix extracellular phosphoglycoprotein [Mastomys coucha]